jgi:hypothetical protein
LALLTSLELAQIEAGLDQRYRSRR